MEIITNLIAEALAIIVTAGVYYLWSKYVRPWIMDNNLSQAAEVAVYAAEALFGRYKGEDKLKYAMEQMKKKGWNIDYDGVKNAVLAAWLKLNTSQIEAGEKDATGNMDEESN